MAMAGQNKKADREDPRQYLATRVTELSEALSEIRPLVEQARQQIRFGYLDKTDKILQTVQVKIDDLDSRWSANPMHDEVRSTPMHDEVRSTLTAREIETLQHVSQGKTNIEIGKAMFLSDQTVKTHLQHIYRIMGVNDRASAVAKALRTGLMP